MFNATNSNSIISKSKNIFWTFFPISKICIKFWILSKKIWPLEVIYFCNYRLRKTGLLQCPKKPRFRTLMDSQHVKVSERLLKSWRQYFCHISWSLWKEISSKNFVLVVFEILRLFLNMLTPDDKYSLSVKASV